MRLNCFRKTMTLLTAIIMIYLTFLPALSLAGVFITPGQPMTPGKAISGGSPITGGKFMIPGQVYKPGKAVDGGKAGTVSGQVILPGNPMKKGIFIIPNSPPTYPQTNWFLNPMNPSSPLNGGAALVGGTGPNGGQGLQGGTVPNGGEGLQGGTGPNGGQGLVGGSGPNGGQGLVGGNGPNGGQSLVGGNGPNGGQGLVGGTGPNSGQQLVAGTGSTGKDLVTGKNPNGKATNGNTRSSNDEVPSTLNVLVKTTDDERGWYSHFTGLFEDYKTYGLGFLNREVVGAGLSMYAGFNMERIPGKNGYKVNGEKNFKNKLLDSMYHKYKTYDVNGNERSLGIHTKRIKEKTLNAFLESKGLRTRGQGIWNYVGKNFLTNLKDGWNPLSWNGGNVGWRKVGLNKSFYSGSSLAKMNGPINYIMAVAAPIWDYGVGDKKKIGILSSDFASELTVEVGIGVASTAIGSVASSFAAGAAVGSFIPGFGTVVGAAVGLGVGLVTTYLINGTGRGRRIKAAVTKGIKGFYSGIAKSIKNGYRKLGDRFG